MGHQYSESGLETLLVTFCKESMNKIFAWIILAFFTLSILGGLKMIVTYIFMVIDSTKEANAKGFVFLVLFTAGIIMGVCTIFAAFKSLLENDENIDDNNKYQ